MIAELLLIGAASVFDNRCSSATSCAGPSPRAVYWMQNVNGRRLEGVCFPKGYTLRDLEKEFGRQSVSAARRAIKVKYGCVRNEILHR